MAPKRLTFYFWVLWAEVGSFNGSQPEGKAGLKQAKV